MKPRDAVRYSYELTRCLRDHNRRDPIHFYLLGENYKVLRDGSYYIKNKDKWEECDNPFA